VRHQCQCSFIDLVGLEQILCHLFLKDGVVVPQVDVSSPESFFLGRWSLLDCGFVHFASLGHIASGLLQQCEVDPSIIVKGIL